MQCPNCGKETVNINGRQVCLDCGIEISNTSISDNNQQTTVSNSNVDVPDQGTPPAIQPVQNQDIVANNVPDLNVDQNLSQIQNDLTVLAQNTDQAQPDISQTDMSQNENPNIAVKTDPIVSQVVPNESIDIQGTVESAVSNTMPAEPENIIDQITVQQEENAVSDETSISSEITVPTQAPATPPPEIKFVQSDSPVKQPNVISDGGSLINESSPDQNNQQQTHEETAVAPSNFHDEYKASYELGATDEISQPESVSQNNIDSFNIPQPETPENIQNIMPNQNFPVNQVSYNVVQTGGSNLETYLSNPTVEGKIGDSNIEFYPATSISGVKIGNFLKIFFIVALISTLVGIMYLNYNKIISVFNATIDAQTEQAEESSGVIQ